LSEDIHKITVTHIDDRHHVSGPSPAGPKEFDQNKIRQLNIIFKIIQRRYFVPTIYAISGALLLLILTIIFYTYVLCLKVETAIITAPIETMGAPLTGIISEIFVIPGQSIKKGTPLVKIENIDIERDLEMARVYLAESKLTILHYQNLLANEQQRLKIYQSVGSSRVKSAQAQVNASKQDKVAAEHNLNRLRALHDKHYISEATWEAEFAKYINAQEKLKSAEAERHLESNSLNAIDKGIYFTGSKIEGVARDLSAEIETAQMKSKLNEEKVKIYENILNKLTVKAPNDGTVLRILKNIGATTDNNNPILFIEPFNANKNIVAYLTQAEIVHINSSKKVKLYVPSNGKTYLGHILEINRTDGFVDWINAQYKWRDLDLDRSAMVTIRISQNDQMDFNQHAYAGMPVIVYFARRLV